MSVAQPSVEGLHAIKSQLSWRRYLAEIWLRRDFLMVVPRHDARSKQMTNVLGQAWHLLNPALMILVYYFIFGVVLDGDRGIEHYVSFLTLGILTFQLIQRIVVESSSTIQRHLGLIRTIQFPRALLPLSDTIEHVVAFLPTILLLYLVAFLEGVSFRWTMLLLPVTVLPAILIAGGFAFFAARIGAGLPDLKDILPHLFRLLLYTSGVIFSLDAMISSDSARLLMKANPVYLSILVTRWSVLGTAVSTNELLALTGWCIVVPVSGFMAFRSKEQSYGA